MYNRLYLVYALDYDEYDNNYCYWVGYDPFIMERFRMNLERMGYKTLVLFA